MEKLFDLNLPVVKSNDELREVFNNYPQYHRTFLAIHVRDDFRLVKVFLENSWVDFYQCADPDFKPQFQTTSFHERAWELYLYAVLRDRNPHLLPKNKQRSGGPDFCMKTENNKIWIEAVAAGEGTGDNKVETIEDILRNIPSGQMVTRGGALDELNHPKVLRITSVLDEKWGKYIALYKDKHVKPSDSFVIAVSGAQINGGMMAESLILEAVAGVDPAMRLPKLSDGSFGKPFHRLRGRISKPSSTSPVDIAIFERCEYADLSAVIYCGNRIIESVTKYGDNLGKDIVIIYNPKTKTDKQIPKEIFNFGIRYERVADGWKRVEL